MTIIIAILVIRNNAGLPTEITAGFGMSVEPLHLRSVVSVKYWSVCGSCPEMQKRGSQMVGGMAVHDCCSLILNHARDNGSSESSSLVLLVC